MIDLLQTLEGGLVAASVYLLVGLGWNIVLNTCGYLNLSIGGFYVFAAILSFKLPGWLGLASPVLVGLLVVLIIGLTGGVVERTLVRPLKLRGMRVLIVTMGVEIVLVEVNAKLAPEVAVRPEDFVKGPSLDLGGVLVARQELFVVGAAVLATLVLVAFFHGTDLGRTFRACADDRRAAAELGVDVPRVETIAFAAGLMFTALAAVVVAPAQGVAATSGTMIAIKGFLAVSLGGLGRYSGAVVGALAVGLSEAVIARYWNTEVRDLVVLTGLVVALLNAPGDRHVRRGGRWRSPNRRGGVRVDAAAG